MNAKDNSQVEAVQTDFMSIFYDRDLQGILVLVLAVLVYLRFNQNVFKLSNTNA